jgi:predicted transcriptional regulator of viral defense system
MKRDKSTRVWTPNDLLDLETTSAIDKVLQRLVLAGDIRRIDRGLYDVPPRELADRQTERTHTAIIGAVARREKARFLPNGITAANQLGLTGAVPTKVTVHTDARLRPIHSTAW